MVTESYARINAVVHAMTRDAVQITSTDKGSFPGPFWIPRTLIHGGDELELGKAMRNDRVTFRLMEWKARELGL